MDIQQFEEIFGYRVSDSSIRIPRAIDKWFDHPKNADGLRLRNLVMQHRAARIAELEARIAKERRRIADAELKLATKPTRKAVEDLRIAPRQIAGFERRLQPLQNWDDATERDDRIFPMEYVPIVMMAGGQPVIRLARYHCRQSGKPVAIDREKDGLYNARRNNLSGWWRNEFGRTHAVMLVNTFWEHVEAPGGSRVLHFMPEPRDLMHVACIYSVWNNPAGGKALLSFAAVTDDPPVEIAATGHDRCMVNLKPENVRAWLTPEGRSDAELQALLEDKDRPFYQHELVDAA